MNIGVRCTSRRWFRIFFGANIDEMLSELAQLAQRPSRKRMRRRESAAVMDAVVPGFGVRVSEAGRKTFMLAARYPGSASYTRRALGVYGAMSLEKARAKAKAWLELIEKKIDPVAEQERLAIEAQRKRENSFRAIAEA
jgi:Arm domain-containing DNA-binding protein